MIGKSDLKVKSKDKRKDLTQRREGAKQMKQRTAVWKAVEYPGMEHLTLRNEEDSMRFAGVVIGVDEGGAFRLDYSIRCDAGYKVQDVWVSLKGVKVLRLTSDGQGTWWDWFDADAKPLPELAGCLDIDITATPFTNTLPIKRIDWKPGQTETLRMVYFSIPEMTFHADEQRYTCIDERTFRFEQVSTGFTAVLTVDDDGLVLDYPGLFERVKS